MLSVAVNSADSQQMKFYGGKEPRISSRDCLLILFKKKENSINCRSSSIEATRLSDSICTSYVNYDIDFDPIITDDSIQNNEDNTFDNDETELNENLALLDELFLSEDEHFPTKDASGLVPLHPYTNISRNEFCTNLIRVFREANLCKIYSSTIPQPHNLPTSVNAVLKYIQGKLYFH